MRVRFHPSGGNNFLEVQVNGVWGLVCAGDLKRWREEGRVACRSLQKEYFKSVRAEVATGYSGARYSGELECSGSEAYPEDCTFRFSRGSCSRFLAVDCTEGGLGHCCLRYGWEGAMHRVLHSGTITDAGRMHMGSPCKHILT